MIDSKFKTQPCVMTIAGTDSGGGAGVQADLKTFTALACYGTSTITAMTAQNTLGVQDIHPVSVDFIKSQLTSVLDDIPIVALKTGMLYDAPTIHIIVSTLKSYAPAIPPIICDPVCFSTSGHTLLKPEAVSTLIQELFPLTSLITPNASEAKFILEAATSSPFDIYSLDAMVQASMRLVQLGPKAVLVKGGHFSPSLDEVMAFSSPGIRVEVFQDAGLQAYNYEILKRRLGDEPPIVLDVLYDSEIQQISMFARPRIESTSTHGTGCTLSAAITSYLAHGYDLSKAVRLAGLYTHRGIEMAEPIGKGHGPLNHLHSLVSRAVPRPTKCNPYPIIELLISQSSDIWREYVQHEFVVLLARGTLPMDNFIHFMRQDYLYLKYYARAYALLAAKSPTFDEIRLATQTILNVLHEVENTHLTYCAELGLTKEDLETTQESIATTAYGAFIMDVGFQGDVVKLSMALLACLLGYGEVGLWIQKNIVQFFGTSDLSNHPYRRWIEDYSGEQYQAAVKMGMDAIEAITDSPSKSSLDEWEAIWRKCTLLETNFWDSAMVHGQNVQKRS